MIRNNKRKKEYKTAIKKLRKMRVVLGAVGQHKKSKLTNAELWRVHEFGVRRNGVNIPARAPIRKTFRDRGVQRQLYKATVSLIEKNGIEDIPSIARGLGVLMKSSVQKTVSRRVSPENAPSTLARKRGDLPLVDSRQMVYRSLQEDYYL